MRTVAIAAAWTAAQLTVAVYVLRPTPDHHLITLLLLLGTGTAAVAIALVRRTRRAYLTALEDRAARLETERDQRARLATAAERARVAREMHDIVGHHVSVIVGLADGGARLAANREEQAAEPLRLIGDTGRQALGELRRVLDVLRDDDQDGGLTPQPGVADLDRLLPSVRAAGLTVTYRTSGEPHRLGPGLQLTIYRIVQEALTNTLKHAGPGASAEVTVAADEDQVRVRVEDSGSAHPPPPSDPPHHGLAGIRERAGLYGGDVTAGPSPAGPSPGGRGWTVDVRLTAEPVAGTGSLAGPLTSTDPGI
jgi:signal transduction histidine kinase